MAFITQCITAKQKKHITEVEIVLELRSIVLKLNIFSDPSTTLKMKYNQQGNDTLVVCKKQNVDWTVENRYFMTIFVQELEEILLDPELDLKRFKFLYNPSGSFDLSYIREYMDPLISRFYENLWRTLKLRRSRINVKIVFLQARDIAQVCLVLSQIDYKSIKFIWLGMEFGDNIVKIGELVSLACNQWKYAKGLTMRMKLNLVTTKNLDEVKKVRHM
ncbi:hypothetical protein GCK72_026211 [Caenorhabditis remanei]|uniref:DUF38 domain-containing protein n=1 Tax=Caenorhabditis remanei TaxID=31234 RepID=A0A6A5G4W2_CAERE|nr:hypothetical protein GCK72_026211 [Caenorhabditis remanei]KAF1749742.1 hypothetical protein GCK72_026211 [Caenorhabditis remanei]